MDIERYLSLELTDEEAYRAKYPKAPWFWKVATAVHLFRERLRAFASPLSHIAIDESTIKFFSRNKNKSLMKHKPAKEGFLLYSLYSYGGFIHDFILFLSK